MNFIVADDHPYYRKGVIRQLETLTYPKTIYEASHGLEVLEILDHSPSIDLIILDIKMPVLDGYQTFLSIVKRYPKMRVLMNSMYNDESILLSFLKAGINGFILKTDENLLPAIELVLAERYYFSKELEPIIIKAQRELRSYSPIELNAQEYKLIHLLAIGKNSQEISELLSLTKYTIETYRKNLIRKFGVSNTVHLIQVAHNSGLI